MKDKNGFLEGICGDSCYTPAFSGVHSCPPIRSRSRLIAVLGSRREALLDNSPVRMKSELALFDVLVDVRIEYLNQEIVIIRYHHILVTNNRLYC